jgi:hypothetical protein
MLFFLTGVLTTRTEVVFRRIGIDFLVIVGMIINNVYY